MKGDVTVGAQCFPGVRRDNLFVAATTPGWTSWHPTVFNPRALVVQKKKGRSKGSEEETEEEETETVLSYTTLVLINQPTCDAPDGAACAVDFMLLHANVTGAGGYPAKQRDSYTNNGAPETRNSFNLSFACL